MATKSSPPPGCAPRNRRGITICLLLAGMLAVMLPATCAEPVTGGKIRLLMLSGGNHCGGQQTTPLLRKMYEERGRFTVAVCEAVAALKAADFARHDVVVSDGTICPDHPVRRWPAEVEQAFLDYVAAGHGLVIYGGAIAGWNDWPAFADMVGQSFQKGGGHGNRHSFVVNILAPAHPVTKGMKDFQHVPDELRYRVSVRSTGRVLATALVESVNSGGEQREPVVVVTDYGQGRTFSCGLGHPEAMSGPGWRALMLRGAEWAATGQVTIGVPTNWVAVGGARAEEMRQANHTRMAPGGAGKIKFRLDNIRPDGLRGPPDGLVSVAYEFCVPAGPEAYAEVRRIDASVMISPGSRGRIGCSKQQALCIGNTHRRNWREVLLALASLPYVAEIRECFFE